MSYDELIPGLTAFMEDEEAGAEDESEAVAEAKEEAEDAKDAQAAAEEETEAVKDESNAEAATAMFERLAIMEDHIKRYGVDRTFLNLCNYDNVLSNGLGIHLPSAESFDAVGNPQSAESIACLEGIGEYWEKLKAFVKKLWEKFKNWLDRVAINLSNFFNKANVSNGRLKQLIDKAKAKDGGKIKDMKSSAATKKVFSPGYANALIGKLKEFIDKKLNNLAKLAPTLDHMVSEAGKNDIEQFNKDSIAKMAELKRLRSDAKEKSVAVSTISLETCDKLLQQVVELSKLYGQLNAQVKVIKSDLQKNVDKLLDQLKAGEGADNKENIKAVKKYSAYMNAIRSETSKVIPYVLWCQNQFKNTIMARCKASLGSDVSSDMEKTPKA